MTFEYFIRVFSVCSIAVYTHKNDTEREKTPKKDSAAI